MTTIATNGHTIEIKALGSERIFYDGKLVSKKFSIFGSTHIFRTEEDGENIQYEIDIGTRWHGFSFHCTVRREGKIIFTNR